MGRFALVALAAGLLLGMIGSPFAQSYDREGTRYRGYAPPVEAPRPYYRGRFYQGRGYYRPGRYRTWNGCQRGWTVQDGLCKPYRGY
jgi:hypothetical protein